MSHDIREIDEATNAVKDFLKSKKKTRFAPKIGIILGTGLGGLTRKISDKAAISYRHVPGFPITTVTTHAGQLVAGRIAGRDVIAMDGRFHYYEGYSMEQITLPVRVMKKLGVEILLVSNVSGGLNPKYRLGDICILDDHINLMGANPLIGPQDARLGSPFPDMIEPYSKKHQETIRQIALKNSIPVNTGTVYVAVAGPNLETRAEYRFLRGIGADLVGMSTVPEVLVAVQAGIQVVGFSIVSDMCLADSLEPVKIEKIIRTGQEAEPKLTTIVTEFIRTVK